MLTQVRNLSLDRIRELGIPVLLNESQTAHILGVECDTLRRWRREGKGPKFLRLGGRTIRYSSKDLVELLTDPGGLHRYAN